jgi:hypothetical protein
MRLLMGVIVGIVLTVTAAFIADSLATVGSAPGGPQGTTVTITAQASAEQQ